MAYSDNIPTVTGYASPAPNSCVILIGLILIILAPTSQWVVTAATKVVHYIFMSTNFANWEEIGHRKSKICIRLST